MPYLGEGLKTPHSGWKAIFLIIPDAGARQ
jgi:hypothetical protein